MVVGVGVGAVGEGGRRWLMRCFFIFHFGGEERDGDLLLELKLEKHEQKMITHKKGHNSM